MFASNLLKGMIKKDIGVQTAGGILTPTQRSPKCHLRSLTNFDVFSWDLD